MTVILYSAFAPFNYIATAFFLNTWLKDSNNREEAQNIAGFLMSVPFIIAIFLVPLLGTNIFIAGYFIDRFGKRAYLLIFASFLSVITYTLFYLINPIVPVIINGISYSIFAGVIWSSISFVIKPELTGFGYGMISSMLNVAMVFMPLFIAHIVTTTHNYFNAILFFIVLSCLSFTISIIIAKVDNDKNSII